ncbi:hypothetical protein MMC07_000611 [Pseudocyphellaria aurata]|nr:hypothetical protein [Pseudocyphellaria aurata]
MTEPANTSIHDDTEPEDNARAPTNTVIHDGTSQDQSLRSATARNPLPTATSTRDWILYLPLEVRRIIYRHVLQEPCELSWNWQQSGGVQAIPSLFFTSRLIYRESIEAFYRVNIFFVHTWHPTLTISPSRPMSQMLQNLHIPIYLLIHRRAHRRRFVEVMNTFGDHGSIRGTLYVEINMHHPDNGFTRPSMQFYHRGLGRFTNFRRVEVEIYYSNRPNLSCAMQYEGVENALQHMLGPATFGLLGNDRNGLTFFPQAFLNRQTPQESDDWIDHLGELHLLWNEDDSTSRQNTDHGADESGPSAQNGDD